MGRGSDRYGLGRHRAGYRRRSAGVSGQSAAGQGLYDWTGFYVGGHMGYASGNSNWTANPNQAGLPSTSGSVDMTLPIDSFAETKSFFNRS